MLTIGAAKSKVPIPVTLSDEYIERVVRVGRTIDKRFLPRVTWCEAP